MYKSSDLNDTEVQAELKNQLEFLAGVFSTEAKCGAITLPKQATVYMLYKEDGPILFPGVPGFQFPVRTRIVLYFVDSRLTCSFSDRAAPAPVGGSGSGGDVGSEVDVTGGPESTGGPGGVGGVGGGQQGGMVGDESVAAPTSGGDVDVSDAGVGGIGGPEATSAGDATDGVVPSGGPDVAADGSRDPPVGVVGDGTADGSIDGGVEATGSPTGDDSSVSGVGFVPGGPNGAGDSGFQNDTFPGASESAGPEGGAGQDAAVGDGPIGAGSSADDLEASPSASEEAGVQSEFEPFAEASDAEVSPESAACFPGDATVQVEGFGNKKMNELEIGEKVLVAPSTYSEVILFTHRDPAFRGSFVHIKTDGNVVLRATAGHFLYVNGVLTQTADVKVGDTLRTDAGENTSVTSVTRTAGEGLYNPQTIQGDIIVDGIQASTFTTAVKPDVARMLLKPIEGLYRLGGITERTAGNLFKCGAKLNCA